MKFTQKMVLAVALMVTGFGFAQDRVIPFDQVPSGIKNYVKKHFANQTVVQSEIDRDLMNKKYEIKLSDGTELKFDNDGKIKEIDSKSKLPDAVVPAKIRQYVAKNYPANVITEWELDGKIQQVGLDNDIDLEFTLSGDFVRIDR